MAVVTGPLVRAAGVLLWRPAGGGLSGPFAGADAGADGESVEIALVHRPKYDDWSLPKGKLDPGEHVLRCALREVEEETGHRVTLGRPLPTQYYPVTGATKEVRYWVARADGEAPEWPGTAEIDRLAFLSVPYALEQLTHERDSDLVRIALSAPLETEPVIVLRHARAMPRKTWEGPDVERPLDAAGHAQAERLAGLLLAYGPRRVVSSDAVRCTQTVAPYAAGARTTVELEPRVSEEGFAAYPDRAGEVAAALREAGQSAVLCSHRPVLPALLEAVLAGADADDVGTTGAEIRLAPGSFLVAHVNDGVALATERHDV